MRREQRTRMFYTLNPVPGGYGPSYPVGHVGFNQNVVPPQYSQNYGQYQTYGQYPQQPVGPLFFNPQYPPPQWTAGNTSVNPTPTPYQPSENGQSIGKKD